MTQTVDAIYEHGTLRIIQPAKLQLSEGQHVRLIIEPTPSVSDVLTLATSVYEGLTEQEIAEVEALAERQEPFFGKRQ